MDKDVPMPWDMCMGPREPRGTFLGVDIYHAFRVLVKRLLLPFHHVVCLVTWHAFSK
jgi:hypothetical protein